MAKRGGPPDIRNQLGSFLTAAWQQLDQVREVVTQRTKAGRVQIDLVLLRRKRKDALAKLGEATARLARAGKLDEEDFPELSGPLAAYEALEDKIEREERRAQAVASGHTDDDYADMDADDHEEYDEDDGAVAAGAEFDEDSGGRPVRRAAAAAGDDAADDAVDDDDDDGLEDLDDDDDAPPDVDKPPPRR